MFYKGYNETYDFRKRKTIRAFGDEIRNNIINMHIHSIEEAKNEMPKERYISTQKRQQIIDELRLI